MATKTREIDPETGSVPAGLKLPIGGLLALFATGFLGILNETIPAGLLPEMSKSLGVSESVAGQTVTVWALATAVTAIPLNALLKSWGRRTVLVLALVTFVAANTAVALVDDFTVLMIARFVGGVGAGLAWSNLGGYAGRLVEPRHRGRAITIAMAGTPIALALGLPVGTLVGDLAGWHATFGLVALVSAGVIVWAFLALPNLRGLQSGDHVTFRAILTMPGVRLILAVVAGFMIAHNMVYTYVGPLAIAAGTGTQIEWVLLVFGVTALVSIWVTGAFVDPHHRRLVLLSTILVGSAALILGFVAITPVLLYVGVAVWGYGFGGAATLFVTAGIRATKADGVQAILVTVFNLSIAIGGIVGGLLLTGLGITTVPLVAAALMVPTIAATFGSHRHAFPAWPARS